jgi:hypothetical protein
LGVFDDGYFSYRFDGFRLGREQNGLDSIAGISPFSGMAPR